MKSKSWLKCINVQLMQGWLKTLSVDNISYALLLAIYLTTSASSS